MKQIPGTNKVCKLETNIDDSTGEVLGHVMELLMSHGAKDVHYIPVMMKKNRPAYLLNVLCDEEKRKELRDKYNLNNKNVIGHIGRFQPQKNQEFLVEIFSRYLKQDNNAILMLIGQGENEDKVKQRISELGINDKVMLMGVRQDVNELLQAMDVFVLPSLLRLRRQDCHV